MNPFFFFFFNLSAQVDSNLQHIFNLALTSALLLFKCHSVSVAPFDVFWIGREFCSSNIRCNSIWHCCVRLRCLPVPIWNMTFNANISPYNCITWIGADCCALLVIEIYDYSFEVMEYALAFSA